MMKKLDVIASDKNGINIIAIYHKDEDGLIYHSAALIDGALVINNPIEFGIGRLSDGYRMAIKEEEEALFYAIKNRGYIENPITHLYTKLRAAYGETYYYITETGEIIDDTEAKFSIDNERFNIGNYALDPDKLTAKRDKILKILKGGDVVEANQWIHVKDKLPFEDFKEDDEMTYPVLVKSEEGGLDIMRMYYYKSKNAWMWSNKYNFTPKYWMPIPILKEE